jgi:hypothetical protein
VAEETQPEEQTTPNPRRLPWLVLMLLGVSALHLSWLSWPVGWGDDYAQYLAHARNLATGEAYGQVEYLHRPGLSGWPRAYPPVFPALLAPVYKLWGLNLTAFKVYDLLLLLAALLAMDLALRRHGVRPWKALAIVGLLGISPMLLVRARIMSDVPYLIWAYLALGVAFTLTERTDSDPRRRALTAVGLGVLIYLAWGTRGLGAFLLPAFGAADLWRHRRVRREAILVAAVALGLGVLEALVLPERHELAGSGSVAGLGHRVQHYFTVSSYLFDAGLSVGLQRGLFALGLGLAAIGALRRWRRKVAALDVYSVLHVLVIFVWPFTQGPRMLYPLLPVFLLYAQEGWEALLDRWKTAPGALRWLPAAVLLLCFGARLTAKAQPPPGGPESPHVVALFAYLREHVPPDEAVLFPKPRLLSLVTGVRACSLGPQGTPEEEAEEWRYLEAHRVRHVVLAEEWLLGRELAGFVAKHKDRYTICYRNPGFAVLEQR